jgi:hypothetical protein
MELIDELQASAALFAVSFEGHSVGRKSGLDFQEKKTKISCLSLESNPGSSSP